MTYDLHDHEETRYTDEATGGQKGAKLTQVGALDPVALIELARVAGYGAAKYAPFNYLKGYDWALSFNAMQRHAMLFWSGEDIDPESGRHHMAMAAWHALTLVSFITRNVGTDTRPPALCGEGDEPRDRSSFPHHWAPVVEPWGKGDGPVTMAGVEEWRGYGRWARENCLHPTTYLSVAGTTNCKQCFKVLLDEHGCTYTGTVT